MVSRDLEGDRRNQDDVDVDDGGGSLRMPKIIPGNVAWPRCRSVLDYTYLQRAKIPKITKKEKK